MIQRIQSIYLFVCAILILLMLLMPFAKFSVNSQIYIFSPKGVISEEQERLLINTYPLLILILIISIISLSSIFLYKRRVLQIRLGIFNKLLMLGFYIMAYFYIHKILSEMHSTIHYLPSSIFPLISIILTILANKNIRKDENLVRSYERIR